MVPDKFALVSALVDFLVLTKMAEGSKSEELTFAGFLEAVEKTNTAKIVDEILAGLSDNSEDSEDFDFEGDADDVEERP
jgi:hypothetical protein